MCLHFTATQALQRVGNYWHMLPIKEQARKAIWNAVNPHTGKRRIDEAFPPEIRKRTNDQEMLIEFINGSTWQVLGSDSYDSLVGAAPVGVVFSEWALADPQSWAYIRPILAENNGWALFITTPRGRNHAATFFKMAEEAPDWYCEKLSAYETGVFSQETLDAELRENIAQFGPEEGRAKFEQEYMCSFDAALPGAYFGSHMIQAEKEGRLSTVPHTPGVPVYPAFDFGKGLSNSTAITFMQIVGREPRVIDYFESNDGNIPLFAQVLSEKDYHYGELILPHDAGHPRLSGQGLSYADEFKTLGFSVHVLEQTPRLVSDIQNIAKVLPQVWIDTRRAERLIECLRNYHREWDEKAKVFKTTPKRDWSSHGVDSFRYACVAFLTGLMESHVQHKQVAGAFTVDKWSPF